MLDGAREFFRSRRVLEVETPTLSAAAVSDPQIESLATKFAGMPGGLVEHALLPLPPAFQRGCQIEGRVALQAADNADPLTGEQIEPSFPHLQMVVPVGETALGKQCGRRFLVAAVFI